jgi:phosphoglycolate phosphatase
MYIEKYRHIFWDWNGTLLNDRWLSVDIMNGMLSKYGLPSIDEKKYLEIFDFPVHEYYLKLGFDFNRVEFKRVGLEFIEYYQQRWQECLLQPGAKDALKTFYVSGIPQSILSAANKSMIQIGVQHFQLENYFAHLIGLDHHYATSKVEVGLTYLHTLEIDPAKVLMIGDTLHDYHVARELSIDCILLTHGHHPLYKLESLSIPLLHSLDQVFDYM